MSTKTRSDTPQGEPGLPTWTLQGRTYVPVSSPSLNCGLDLLDEDPAGSLADEGGPPPTAAGNDRAR